MMLLDQMDDASLVKMARGEVPTHMRAALLQAMYGRVKKYAEGGRVSAPDFSWITPQVAAQLLNRPPGTELPPGITDEILKERVASARSSPLREAKPVEVGRDGYLTPTQRLQMQRGEEPAPSLRDRITVDAIPGKAAPSVNMPIARAAQAEPTTTPSPLAAAASQSSPPPAKPAPARPYTPTPAPRSPLAQAARRAPAPQPQSTEPDVQVPPMRPQPEDATPRAQESTAPTTATADVQKPGAKEPPTWASPLAAAGLALMASPHRNIGRAIGEAGLTGLRQMQVEEEQRRRAAELARREARDSRQLDQADRQLGQQAELTREQIAARKDMAEENRRVREADIAARAADRADARSYQGQRLALDQAEAGLRKRLIEAQIAAAGQKADPTKLIYDTAADLMGKNPMLSQQEASRIAVELYGSIMNRGQMQAAPAGPLGAIPQGGRMPNPAGLLP